MEIFKLLNLVNKSKSKFNMDYYIPKIWDGFNLINNYENIININPYEYLENIINYCIENFYNENDDYSKSIALNKKEFNNGDWIKNQIVYSMMIRTSTTFDHNQDGKITLDNQTTETGTFIKTIMMLPLLKKMNISSLYLLPITKHDTQTKKGELGSPYATSNFYELDPLLSDNLVNKDIDLNTQFKVLVELCHILNIRVIIDIIPRTIAINNDYIKTNPEWFYWVDNSLNTKYKAPYIETLGKIVTPTPDLIEEIYTNKSVLNHISMFKYNPKDSNKLLWNQIIKDENILKDIQDKYNLTIASAFSDHINDPQPPWSDITFLRMYLDHLPHALKYIDEITPPYILFDTIKNNFYQGLKANLELWEMLSNIIPHYQNNFGIDGARIDMGHALSNELIDLIIKKAKIIDPSFCFIAEELNPENDKISHSKGYNMILGNGFSELSKPNTSRIYDFIKTAKILEIPMFACCETHDTPRIISRENYEFASMATILSLLIPNTIPFINSGQEFNELAPMNLGLDSNKSDQFVLSKDDPYFSKLALFDIYQFHYDNEKINEFVNLIKIGTDILNKYNIKNMESNILLHDDDTIQIDLKGKLQNIIVLVNPYDYKSDNKVLSFKDKNINILLSNKNNYDVLINEDSILTTLNNYEIQIYLIK